MKRLLFVISAFILFSASHLLSQQSGNTYVDQVTLVTSQLGFREQSPKTVTLLPSSRDSLFPDEIPFYLHPVGARMNREQKLPKAWTGKFFDWPIDISKGKYIDQDKFVADSSSYRGVLKKINTRWGTFWQGDFTPFTNDGIYQIETEYGFTTPFVIENNPYSRLIRSYLNYLYCQRSGVEIPGIRPLENADDGVIDTNGMYVPAAGGWNDAGDFRKWISQTSSHIEALSLIIQHADPAYRKAAIDEIKWGNKFFQAMITPEGKVYEDIGSGPLRGGKNYKDDWWCENHAGCLGSGEGKSDNIMENGDERKIRTTYNPVCQFLFIRNQVFASRVLEPADAMKCAHLAELGWQYSRKAGHDGRTLFVSEELLAACELYASGLAHVSAGEIETFANDILNSQETGDYKLNGYFYEKDKADGYRSIVWNAEPAMALLRVCELNIPGKADLTKRSAKAVQRYIENYILKDAAGNPFSVTPYGVFVKPAHSDEITFRDAGAGNFVRTFINPLNPQEMVHGTDAVLMQHAYLLARAALLWKKDIYREESEKLIQWATGNNTTGLCLFTGVGFRHPVIASYVNYRIPDATVDGFVGRPDDTPYMEASNAVEWNTQEVWGVPFYHAIGAVTYLTLLQNLH